jgi:HK97 family phage portal protein
MQSYAWAKGFPVYNQSDVIANVNKYLTSDDLYSIVRRIARTAAMIPFKVYEVKNDKALKEYTFASSQKNHNTQTLLKKQFLKVKALEEVPQDNYLQMLIDNPNQCYSATEFYEGLYSMRLITGNSYIYAPPLELGPNAGKPGEIWIMPSQFVSLQVSQSWPRIILGYRLQISEILNLNVEDVTHTMYFNPDFGVYGTELIGLSPLRAGSKILTRQEAETDYSVNSFQNSGISGIVTNESIQGGDLDIAAAGKLKSDFYAEASGVQNARKLLFTVGKIGYTHVGLSPVDMDLLKSEVRTFKKLCNLYGVSDRLFNNDATGSEISIDVAYKDLYTNAVLPEVYALRDSINRSITPKFNGKGKTFYVDCDITGIMELQDDMKDMATVFSSLPLMNPAVIAKAFNWDYDDDDANMDRYFIKQGYQTIEDAMAAAIQPLPIETENGN